jgi:hypothetical protein
MVERGRFRGALDELPPALVAAWIEQLQPHRRVR